MELVEVTRVTGRERLVQRDLRERKREKERDLSKERVQEIEIWRKKKDAVGRRMSVGLEGKKIRGLLFGVFFFVKLVKFWV